MADGKKRTGINPLAYMGVEPVSPPQLVINNMRPLPNNTAFDIGTLWVIQNPQEVWMLLNLTAGVATWVQLFPGAGGGATNFPCDVGIAIEAGGTMEVVGQAGGGNIVETDGTLGAGNRVTAKLTKGGLGQVPIGGGVGAEPAWANITSAGGTLTITNGINTIDIDVTVPALFTDLRADDGNIAVPLGGVIDVAGGDCISTQVTAPNEIIVNLAQSLDGQIPIGMTGAGPAFANITSTLGTIEITNGANTINLESKTNRDGKSFMAILPTQFNIHPDALLLTVVPIGSYAGVIMTEQYDTAAAFYEGDGAGAPASYTAPVDGIYSFAFTCHFTNNGKFIVMPSLQILTSTAQSFSQKNASYSEWGGGNVQYWCMHITTQIKLFAADIVYFNIIIPAAGGGPADDFTIFGSDYFPVGATYAPPAPTEWTWVSGYLIENQ